MMAVTQEVKFGSRDLGNGVHVIHLLSAKN